MLSRVSRIAGVALVSSIWSIVLSGCGDECDAGWQIRNHECVRVAGADAGDAGSPEVGTQDDAAGDGGDGGGLCTASQMGVACWQTEECTCDTDLCAAQPGTQGFCTRTGCLQDASVCPSGWTCLDLSGMDPTWPAICVQA